MTCKKNLGAMSKSARPACHPIRRHPGARTIDRAVLRRGNLTMNHIARFPDLAPAAVSTRRIVWLR